MERYVATGVLQIGGDGDLAAGGRDVIGVAGQAQLELEVYRMRPGTIVVEDADAEKCPAGSIGMRKDALEAVKDRY